MKCVYLKCLGNKITGYELAGLWICRLQWNEPCKYQRPKFICKK